MSKRLICLSQLSDETGAGLRALTADAAAGILPAHRVAGRWVVDREELAKSDYLAKLDAALAERHFRERRTRRLG